MTVILVIVSITGLLWGLLSVLRGSLIIGCMLYLVSACCLGVDFYRLDAAGLTWSLDRLLLLGLAGAYVVQRQLGRTRPKQLGRTDILLGLFFGLLLFSTFTHDWRATGPDEVPVIMHLVNGYLIPLAIYWIARQSAINERNVHFAYVILTCFGIYLVATALLEITGQWSLIFPKYIADPEIGIHFGRARGPMVQSARFGTYLVVCLATTWMCWGWLARFGRTGQLLAVALVPLYGVAVYFTYTRSVWLGAGIAAVVMVALTWKGIWRPLALASMVAAALLVVAVKGDQLVAFKREFTAAETRQSAYMRSSFAYVSWQMFKDRPLAGFGFGQFPKENVHYLSDRSTALHLESIRGYVHHNTLLSLLVELGLLGLVLFVLILAHWCSMGWRLWWNTSAPPWVRAHGVLLLAALAVYACQVVFHDVSFSPVENSLVFLFAGIASGLHVLTTQTSPYRPLAAGTIAAGRFSEARC